jgi:hypothetical protein
MPATFPNEINTFDFFCSPVVLETLASCANLMHGDRVWCKAKPLRSSRSWRVSKTISSVRFK